MVELANECSRYRHWRMTALVERESFQVNHKRADPMWRREGLKVPQKQLARAGSGSTGLPVCGLLPVCPDDVWAYDLRAGRT
jgi:hypothetical protein